MANIAMRLAIFAASVDAFYLLINGLRFETSLRPAPQRAQRQLDGGCGHDAPIRSRRCTAALFSCVSAEILRGCGAGVTDAASAADSRR